jgi:hypothetical protein
MAADTYNGMSDRWPVNRNPFDQPREAYAVTPSDTLDLTNSAGSNGPSYAEALRIGDITAGSALAVIMGGDKSNNGAGTTVTFSGLARGLFNVQVGA